MNIVYQMPTSDRLGVTMHPAQPDWTFDEIVKVQRIFSSKKPKRDVSFVHLQGKQDENVDVIEYIGLIF